MYFIIYIKPINNNFIIEDNFSYLIKEEFVFYCQSLKHKTKNKNEYPSFWTLVLQQLFYAKELNKHLILIQQLITKFLFAVLKLTSKIQ